MTTPRTTTTSPYTPDFQSENAAASFPQLTFALGNPGAPGTVYLSSNAADNQLTLDIGTTLATKLAAGTPTDPSNGPTATGSLFYLDLSTLNLSDSEFAGISAAAVGWTAVNYTASRQICFAPSALTPFAVGSDILITIGNFVISNPPGGSSAQLTVTFYRVPGITFGDTLGFPSTFPVALVNPPSKNDKDLHQDIVITVPQPFVVCSKDGYPQVSNTISILFQPGPMGRPVTADADTAFVVSFAYAAAPGYGALCSATDAVNHINPQAGINATSWTITPGTNQQSPSWSLVPPPNQTIVGTGTSATLEFDFEGVITSLRPGPTLMMVTYSGIPGYQDGAFAIGLQKAPHVDISSFTVSPPVSVLQNGSAQVTLNWTVNDGGTLTLQPVGKDVTGTSSYTASITETTPFSLTAQGLQLSNAGNIAISNLNAVVMPVINSFIANPGGIAQKDFPSPVALSWNVNTNGNVALTSSVAGQDPNQYSGVGTVGKTAAGPQIFTLAAQDAPGPWANRRIFLSAFAPTLSTYSLTQSAAYAAAAPNASFIAVTNPSAGQVTFISSARYQPTSTPPVSVGRTPGGLAFSPDGSMLYVANSGDGTVSAIQIAGTQGPTPFSATVAATINVGGAPRQVAVAPDGSRIYVTIDNGSGTAGSLVIITPAAGAYTTSSVSVGNGPGGIAVHPSGSQIFVANAFSGSISVVGSTPNGYVLAGTVPNVGTQPHGLAITADGGTLLVANGQGGTVVALNTAALYNSPRTTYTVGNGANQVAVMPSGGYAFVTNNSDNTISLLHLAGATPGSTVATQPYNVGRSPLGIAVTPDSGVVCVCNSGDTGISVLTLARYAQTAPTQDCSGAVTHVAVAPTGKQSVVWYDVQIGSAVPGPIAPATGLLVYDAVLNNISPQMAGTEIEAFAYSPGAADGIAYVAVKGQSTISVVNTGTWQPVTTVNIPDKGTATGRQAIGFAVSGDGTTVFALVADGGRQYSAVVVAVTSPGGPASKRKFAIKSDVVLFTATNNTFTFLEAVPDGSRAFFVNSLDRKIWALDRQAGGTYAVNQNPISTKGSVVATTMLPDGSKMYAIAKTGLASIVVVIDTATLAATANYLSETVLSVSINAMAASPDGHTIFATDGTTAGIRVIDAASFRVTQTLSWTGNVQRPFGIACAPDASRIYVANMASGNLGMIDQVQPA